MTNVDFSKARITDSDFSKAIFQNSNIKKAKVNNVDFSKAIFTDTDLSDTLFENCVFYATNFKTNNKFKNTNFSLSNLENTIFINQDQEKT